MPIYEYRCPACKASFEVMRPMSQSADKAVCPKCGQASDKALSRFACLAKDASGGVAPVGGSSCGGCSGGSCSSCGG
jgi:putative FmdB family regulatory protein